MDKIKILFLGNGSPENGGCEAITKGSIEILSRAIPNATFSDCYFDYTGNNKIDIERNIYPIHFPQKWSIKWILWKLCSLFSDKLVAYVLYFTHKDIIKDADIVLSLGGDTYSLDYGEPSRFIALGKFVKKYQKPFCIWGASVGPFVKGSRTETKMIKHLTEDVDLIFVREEESKEYLESIGISKNVILTADPAFLMKPECCELKIPTLPKQYVCINFSDLMAKYVTGGDIARWKRICIAICNNLLKETSLSLVYIPHVESDYGFMVSIIDHIEDSSRITLIDNSFNAAELKWIISKSICNIACRTHSTIASFSMGIPTLSLGYSVKSKGLNLQMYGSYDFLVYQKDITPNNVIATFKKIIANEQIIRSQLQNRAIEIKSLALNSGIGIKNYLKK